MMTISRFKTQLHKYPTAQRTPDQTHILNLAREVSNPALIKSASIQRRSLTLTPSSLTPWSVDLADRV